jgi:hypothetical protein
MPDNLPQRLSDKLTERDVMLLRLAAGDSARLEVEINALSEELIRRLIRSDPTTVGKGVGQDRLDTVIAGSLPVIRDVYKALYDSIRAQLLDVMADEAAFMPVAVGQSLGVSERTAKVLVGESVKRSTMREIIDNRVITANANDAERLRGFFEREAASHHKRFTGALRQAFSQDENLSQMLSRLKQVTEIVAREADAVIRTGYNHVVSNLRIEMMQRNSVLFRGAIWISRLDSRTSVRCMGLSQGQWDLNTGRPLATSPIQIKFPGPPPAHVNCRSQLHPMTWNAEQIEANGDDRVRQAMASLTDEQRRLLSADPPADESYSEWLRRQSAEVQNNVLGPTRRKLWLDGKIELIDLVTQKGRPLTLKQLQRKVA